jgi:hypothetical protein
MKTWQDVWELQRAWEHDPSWDIENTKGFEDWHEYLLNYRENMEIEKKIAQKAIALDCSQSLAEYILILEERLARIEAQLDK